MPNFIKKMIKRITTKSRKYPIRYDEYGISARKQAFELFDKGRMPEEVIQEMNISLATAKRYYFQWKKLPKNMNASYRLLKSMLKSNSKMMQEMVESLAQKTGMTEDDVLAELQKPWAFRRLALGWWAEKIRISQRDAIMYRLKAAAGLIYLYEYAGIPPQKILDALEKLRKEYT